MRKVELHRHLEGSIRYSTLCAVRGRTPRKRHHFVEGERRGWGPFFSKFAVIRETRFRKSQVARIAREAIRDAAADDILYLELRLAPVYWSIVCPELDAGTAAELIVENALAEAKKRKMVVRFLASMKRDRGPEVNSPSLDAAIALRPWFVGIDIAGDERKFADLRHFNSLFRKADRAGLRLTLHAGEGGGAVNIRHAILRHGARRIGHGTHADRATLKLARRKRVTFEMCPTSNRDTGVWKKLADHPIKPFLLEGNRVSLNTDDPALSSIDLRHECRVARDVIGMDDEQLLQLQVNGLKGAFLDKATKAKLLRRLSARPRTS